MYITCESDAVKSGLGKDRDTISMYVTKLLSCYVLHPEFNKWMLKVRINYEDL
jgi:hypothetical protein